MTWRPILPATKWPRLTPECVADKANWPPAKHKVLISDGTTITVGYRVEVMLEPDFLNWDVAEWKTDRSFPVTPNNITHWMELPNKPS